MPTTGQQMEAWVQLDANHWAHCWRGSWRIVNGICVPADVLRQAASATPVATPTVEELTAMILEARREPGIWRAAVQAKFLAEKIRVAIASAPATLEAARAMLAALEALNLAYIGVPFKATPEQMPALKKASEMARTAITAAKAVGI